MVNIKRECLKRSNNFLYKKFESIFQTEIESLNIDEFTNSHASVMANKHKCNSAEFIEYLLLEKNFNVFWNSAGYYIFQRPNLNISKVFDEIDSYYRTFKDRKGTTLLEIINQYENLSLNDSSYYFSVKSIVEKLNQLKRTN
ncbi:MAG: hypothetical protein JW870_16505 [Candidatus Delongbacteria bacterium]|nr:hypothetical protein [Candidatus Delongbacteria bacterium]